MTALTAPRPGPGSGPGPAGECGPSAAAPGQRPARGYASGKDDYLSRLRKFEGQVRGLQKMVAAGIWCQTWWSRSPR
jgi:hypothetical protein